MMAIYVNKFDKNNNLIQLSLLQNAVVKREYKIKQRGTTFDMRQDHIDSNFSITLWILAQTQMTALSCLII